MIQKVATTAGWSRGLRRHLWHLALLGAGLVALSGCTPHATQAKAVVPVDDERPVFTDVLSPDCMDYALVEGQLANLAKQSMNAYGRIDPGVFSSPAPGKLVINPELSPSPEFKKAFDEVSNDSNALPALVRGFEEATKHCGSAGCPPARYAIKTFEARPPAGNDHFYQWVVDGDELPNVVQWAGFRKLYASRPALCYVLPSLQVRTRASGYLITASPFAHDERDRLARSASSEAPDDAVVAGHGNPCKCLYGDVAKTGSCTPCGAALFQCLGAADE